jgi:hypothetical protein
MVENSLKTTFVYCLLLLLLLGCFEKKIIKMWKTHYKKKGATLDSFNPSKVWKPKCE